VTARAAPGGRVAGLARVWSVLHPEQRVAAVAASLLIVSTFGPFSFVEAAEILAAAAVLALLKQRAEGREFHLPFGDGTVIFGAGVWCGVLIATRMFDRPPGMTVLALVCALLLAAAGLRERAKRAPDDLPTPLERQAAVGVPVVPARAASPPAPSRQARETPQTPVARRRPLRRKPKPAGDDTTRQLSFDEDPTVALGRDDEPGSGEPPRA
jgi:hypothetical protein